MSTFDHTIFKRYPELKEFIHVLRHEVQQTQRPADEIILDDNDVMKTLKISKRKLQYLKADGVIPTHKLEPDSSRTYYLLGDILDILKKNRIDPINPKF
jgi:hypothetical protein